MTGDPVGKAAHVRHWGVDVAVGAALALSLITVAQAALPRITHTARAPAPAARILPRPAPSPVLIAFSTPAPGYPVISPFGLRQLPWEGHGRLHAGVDIAAPHGEPVLAAADGVVTRLAVDPGYGRFVEVRHAAGLVTRYGHLAGYRPNVRPGAVVKAGQPLGAMGSTGSSTGSHVHFEIRDAAGRPLNPQMFLGRSFARAADLPLKAAARFPRGVRLAYVSNIPRARRQAMQAKIELASASLHAPATSPAATGADDSASGAGASTLDSNDLGWPAGAGERPHARFNFAPGS